MTVYRSERERRDELTGRWQLLDEIMEAIRSEHQTAGEVTEALVMALAKVIVQADYSAEQVEDLKRTLDVTVSFQRGIEKL